LVSYFVSFLEYLNQYVHDKWHNQYVDDKWHCKLLPAVMIQTLYERHSPEGG
jgi:hypothetical protein